MLCANYGDLSRGEREADRIRISFYDRVAPVGDRGLGRRGSFLCASWIWPTTRMAWDAAIGGGCVMMVMLGFVDGMPWGWRMYRRVRGWTDGLVDRALTNRWIVFKERERRCS